jgi:hypothetical protein
MCINFGMRCAALHPSHVLSVVVIFIWAGSLRTANAVASTEGFHSAGGQRSQDWMKQQRTMRKASSGNSTSSGSGSPSRVNDGKRGKVNEGSKIMRRQRIMHQATSELTATTPSKPEDQPKIESLTSNEIKGPRQDESGTATATLHLEPAAEPLALPPDAVRQNEALPIDGAKAAAGAALDAMLAQEASASGAEQNQGPVFPAPSAPAPAPAAAIYPAQAGVYPAQAGVPLVAAPAASVNVTDLLVIFGFASLLFCFCGIVAVRVFVNFQGSGQRAQETSGSSARGSVLHQASRENVTAASPRQMRKHVSMGIKRMESKILTDSDRSGSPRADRRLYGSGRALMRGLSTGIVSEPRRRQQDSGSVTPESGKEETPESVNDLRRILTEHQIDFSSWGTAGLKSVDNLFDEIMNSKCAIKSMRDNFGGRYLEREVRIVSVKIRAETTNGQRWMKTTGAYDNRVGNQQYSVRDCSRKINLFADSKVELQHMLTRELHLSPEWQREHMTLSSMEMKPSQFVAGHGESLPGLRTRFKVELAWMQVNDANALDCSGILGLPHGENFQTSEVKNTENRTRFWSWETQDLNT